MKNNIYESPFSTRYGTEAMRDIFSAQVKYSTWRELWVVLATAEKTLGLGISTEQIAEMEDNIHNIDYARVEAIEKDTHHDVVAHIRAFAEQCPKAAPIIHLGATSAYIVDNTDMVIMHKATERILSLTRDLLLVMASTALAHRDAPTLAYTHLQPAQPTTIGKRICMWTQDVEEDFKRLRHELNGGSIRLLGCKGATGTGASFMELFNGDYHKVQELDSLIAKYLGMGVVSISGQTYSRKNDYYVFSVLSGIAQSLSKIATDLRLLASKGEFSEPFGNNQVGSSAMAYKQNPINCEKVVSLARLVITNTTAIADTAANQWLERSLDDSAIRRVLIPETFLALDEMLNVLMNILSGGVFHDEVALGNLCKEIPKMASEGILMKSVKKGGNRQELHEIMREYLVLGYVDFIQTIVADNRFGLSSAEVLDLTSVDKLVGAAPDQVWDYLSKLTKTTGRGGGKENG